MIIVRATIQTQQASDAGPKTNNFIAIITLLQRIGIVLLHKWFGMHNCVLSMAPQFLFTMIGTNRWYIIDLCICAMMHVGIPNPQWRRKRSRHSQRMHNSQFYVSCKRPITLLPSHFATLLGNSASYDVITSGHSTHYGLCDSFFI